MRCVVIGYTPVDNVFEVDKVRVDDCYLLKRDMGEQRTTQDADLVGEIVPGLVQEDEAANR